MFNKKFLIILALLFSILLIVSSVSAEEVLNEDNNEEVNGLIDSQLSIEDNSLNVNVDDINSDESDNTLSLGGDIISDSSYDSKPKNKLSDSVTSDYGNHVSIQDVTVRDNEDVKIKIDANYLCDYHIIYTIQLIDFDGIIIDSFDDVLYGNQSIDVSLGYLAPGDYKLQFIDEEGLVCVSNIKVLEHEINAKITASNYNSYFNSGQTVNIRTVDKYNNKPISLKVKLVFKKSNGKLYTYFITTDSNGMAKFKVNLSWGTYKLTVTSANSDIDSNKASSTVNVKQIQVKITVPNYSSYYQSGKKLTVKVLNNRGNPVKIKLVYKKAKANAKTYYVTTNSNGIANIIIPVGMGDYKLTVTSANSNFKANKASATVKVNKYVIFKAGKYQGKLTYKQVLALKKAKANNEDLWIEVNTGKYFIYKKPIYKTVKVKKSKWDYKYRLASEDWWGEWGSEWETYNPKTPKGYKLCGTVYKSGNGWSKTYYKYKKKVNYWTTQKVKTGKYKNAKDKITMIVSTNSGNGQYGKGEFIEVWSEEYWNIYEDSILFKKTKIV